MPCRLDYFHVHEWTVLWLKLHEISMQHFVFSKQLLELILSPTLVPLSICAPHCRERISLDYNKQPDTCP